MGRFEEIYRHSLEDVEGFWADAAAAIDWDAPWERVLDDSRAPFYRWFAGGRLNSCYNALDRHVDRGRADQLALIYDSPVTGTAAAFTYRELRDEVARFAGALAAQGVQKGDRVVVYMPMVPEALIAMLACARIGAIHSVVFGGFAAPELASRIEDAGPRSSSPPRAGSSRRRSSRTSRCSTRRSSWSRRSRSAASSCSARSMRLSSIPREISTGTRRSPRPSRLRAFPSRRQTRSTSCTRRARLANRRGSSATTGATRSLLPGR
jgi:hypothetical protein